MNKAVTTFLSCALCAPLCFAQTIIFEDQSMESGITTAGKGHGIAVTDFDRDGWDDIYITVFDGESALFRNDRDGTFSDVSDATGSRVSGTCATALWADVNNDGYPDLYVGQRQEGQSHLFLNREGRSFENISDVSGLEREAPVGSAAFGDYDGDGRVDLFVATTTGADLLYRNTGEASAFFEDVTTAARVEGQSGSRAMQATWIDYDHDGDLDLFAVHDGKNHPNRLYRNDGVLPMAEIARSAGIESVGVGNGMGVAWADFDGNGWEDAYVTRIGTAGFFRNNGDGSFDDVAPESGAARNGMSWGAVFADFDNDADADLFVVSTYGYDGTPTLLYRNDGGTYAEISTRAGVSFPISAYGAAAGDFNRDGLVDLVIANHSGENKLLLNRTIDAGNWLTLELEGRTVNRMAIGARVELVAEGKLQTRTVGGGDSYCAQSSDRLHFGLGAATTIETLTVHWGAQLSRKEIALVVNQTRAVSQTVGLPASAYFLRGDCNADGDPGALATDAVFLLRYVFLGSAEPPCKAACDANADGSVGGNPADAIFMLSYAYLGGAAPEAPFPDCGEGSDADRAIGCASTPAACGDPLPGGL